jgi:hypothetical protein
LYTPTNPSRDQSIRRKEKEKKESTEPSGGVRRARLACPSSTNKEQQRRRSLARSHLSPLAEDYFVGLLTEYYQSNW